MGIYPTYPTLAPRRASDCAPTYPTLAAGPAVTYPLPRQGARTQEAAGRKVCPLHQGVGRSVWWRVCADEGRLRCATLSLLSWLSVLVGFGRGPECLKNFTRPRRIIIRIITAELGKRDIRPGQWESLHAVTDGTQDG